MKLRQGSQENGAEEPIITNLIYRLFCCVSAFLFSTGCINLW